MHAFNLIKADMRRIVRDIPIRVVSIITVSLLVLNYLFWLLIKIVAVEAIGIDAETTISGVNLIMSRIAFSSFMGLGTTGTLACLAASIFMGGDFTFNTVRNRLISGNSRIKTYVSSSITSIILTCGFYLVVSMLALLINFIIFGFNGGFLFKVMLVFLPLYIWLAIFVNFIAQLTRSRALTIVLVIIIISVLPTMLQLVALFMKEGNAVSVFCRFFPLTIFSEVLPINLLSVNAINFDMTTDVILRATLVPIGYLAVMIPLGALAFSKTDIK